MTADELAALEALCERATPGPLTINSVSNLGPRWYVEGQKRPVTDSKPYTSWPVFAQCSLEADAQFIAASRDALPRLISRVRELEAALREIEEFSEYNRECLYCEAVGEPVRHLGDCPVPIARAALDGAGR